jgi:hypothetical protein
MVHSKPSTSHAPPISQTGASIAGVSSLLLPFPTPLPTPPLAWPGLSCLSLLTREEEIAVTELDETSPMPRKFVDDTAAEVTLQDVKNVMRSSERLGNMVAA